MAETSDVRREKPPRGRGRPPGATREDTRARIRDAAADEFAERGYDAASLRAVARRAGVDPALVHHYFADKAALAAAVIEVPLSPDAVLGGRLDGPLDTLGERVVRAVLGAWDSPTVRPAAMTAMRAITSQGPVARMVQEFFRREILRRIAARLEGEDAELRAELAASQVIGVVMARHVLRFEPLASLDFEELVARVAPAVQAHLEGRPTPTDARPPRSGAPDPADPTAGA